MSYKYWVGTRWGEDRPELPEDQFPDILAELESADEEHPDVSLTHESKWCLTVFANGHVIWANLNAALEGDFGRHMKNVPFDKVLRLWHHLAAGELNVVESEPWCEGQG